MGLAYTAFYFSLFLPAVLTMSDPRPRNVTIDRPAGLLVIDWQDGAHCEYPLPASVSSVRACNVAAVMSTWDCPSNPGN